MTDPLRALDQEAGTEAGSRWTGWLILFVRVMAVLSILKGLYHWALVCGVADPTGQAFESSPIAWQTATVFFAIIDLVAGVGLWLAAAWGGVVWLTAASSMIAVEVLFPQVYGGRLPIIVTEFVLIGAYLALMVLAGRERPE